MSAPIVSTNIPEDVSLDLVASSVMLGVSETTVRDLVNKDKLDTKENGEITIGTMKAYYANKGAAPGKRASGKKWFQVRMSVEEAAALSKENYEVRDPAEDEKRRAASRRSDAEATVAELEAQF